MVTMVMVAAMHVFREPLPKIKQLSSDACKTLDTWKQSYLEVRKRIEQSGRDARWEFDRKKLFDRSDYIAQICNDIHSVAQVLYMYIVCTCIPSQSSPLSIAWSF